VNYSGSGLKLTEQFEACRLIGYADVKGVPTGGYGHTGPEVYVGMQITQLQAEQWLLQDVQHAVNAVNALVTVPLTQGEFDALCDFTFNCGAGALASSTLLRLLNNGDYQGAAEQFERWDLAGGQVVAGLLRRRQAEVQEFQA
jgi:lysozyme